MRTATFRNYAFGMAALAIAIVSPLDGRAPPSNWDGLVLTPSKKVDLVYLRPNADFSVYRKVMLDPPEIAYDKDWRRRLDHGTRSLSMRLTDREIRDMIDNGRQMLLRSYAEQFRKAGYEIVTAPDVDVMRVLVGVVDVQIAAPKPTTVGVKTFSEDTGEATLFLEVRDSLSGTLLGRAIDQQVLEDSIAVIRTEAGNRSDFQDQFDDWAKLSARGLGDLRAARPLQ
jgi:hypothetical protein